jgi:hypothetical protein
MKTQRTQTQRPSPSNANRTARPSGKPVNFADTRKHAGHFKTPAPHFDPRVGDMFTTLDGRAVTVKYLSTVLPGHFWCTDGDGGFLINSDGRAYDRRDTLVGFKPSSDEHMRTWHPQRRAA